MVRTSKSNTGQQRSSRSGAGLKHEGSLFRYRAPKVGERRVLIPSTIEGMNAVLGGGYPNKILLGLVGAPKTGKTTFLIQEALGYASAGFDVLIVFNESTREEYIRQVTMNIEAMGIDAKKIEEHLFMLDINRVAVKSANFNTIREYASKTLVAPISTWLSQHPNARLVGIDSISKAINEYPAQAFVLFEEVSHGFQAFFSDAKRSAYKTVVMIIHQKPSDFSARSEGTAFGGLRLIHEQGGALIFTRRPVDTWMARATGLQEFSMVRLLRAEIRKIGCSEDKHIYAMVKGRLNVGMSLADMAEEYGSEKQ